MYCHDRPADTRQIDDPYTFEQLMTPRINHSIVRPLTDRFYDPDDISMGMLVASWSVSVDI
jgi:hypothetical protein